MERRYGNAIPIASCFCESYTRPKEEILLNKIHGLSQSEEQLTARSSPLLVTRPAAEGVKFSFASAADLRRGRGENLSPEIRAASQRGVERLQLHKFWHPVFGLDSQEPADGLKFQTRGIIYGFLEHEQK